MGFRPTLWPTLFTIPAVAALVALGVWQLERLSWKEELIGRLQARSTEAPVPLEGAGDDPSALEFRRVTVTGTFLHDKELFLLDRSREGRPGLHVLTPLRRPDGGVVLVDRGWIPFERRDPATRREGQVSGVVTVEGIVRLAKGPGLFTPDNEPDKNLWFYVDPVAMAQAIGVDRLPPYYVLSADRNVPGGWPRGGQWRIDLRNDHLQYAITWFALAAALIVIYIAYHRRRA